MSFGFSVGDFVTITRLAWTTYQGCKNAGGEYEKLSHEVKNLHIALDRLKDEAEKPESLVRLDIERQSRKTRRIWCNCDDVLREVDALIKKHESLGTSKKKLRDRLRISAKDLGDIRSKIAARTNVINVYIGIVGLSSLGRLEQRGHIDSEKLLEIQEKIDKLPEIQEKIDKLAAEYRAGKREGSILTTYSNDHKETWKEFRRSLLFDGITSDSLTRYGPEVKAYLMQLTKNGMLDEEAYDSDGVQEEIGKETTTSHSLEPAGVAEMPSQTSPSGKPIQILRAEASALSQPEIPHPLTESTVAEIPTKFILPYREIGRQREQGLKADTFPSLRAKEAVPKEAVELAPPLSDPAANQSARNMDASSSDLSQLRHHAESEDQRPATEPCTHSAKSDSPSNSTLNALTRPTTEPIPVFTEAISDEDSESPSLRADNPLTSGWSFSKLKPDPMVVSASELESDSIETTSGQKPERVARVSTSDILNARPKPGTGSDYSALLKNSTEPVSGSEECGKLRRENTEERARIAQVMIKDREERARIEQATWVEKRARVEQVMIEDTERRARIRAFGERARIELAKINEREQASIEDRERTKERARIEQAMIEESEPARIEREDKERTRERARIEQATWVEEVRAKVKQIIIDRERRARIKEREERAMIEEREQARIEGEDKERTRERARIEQAMVEQAKVEGREQARIERAMFEQACDMSHMAQGREQARIEKEGRERTKERARIEQAMVEQAMTEQAEQAYFEHARERRRDRARARKRWKLN